MSAASQAMAAKAPAFAIPAMQGLAPPQRRADSRFLPPLASLAAIPALPAVQRKCGGCAAAEKDELPVQPRLEVGPVGDRYEREADAIAGQVMAMRDPDVAAAAAPAVQRAFGDSEEESEESEVQPRLKAAPAGAAPAVQRACSACSASDKEKVRARRAEAEGGSETIQASHGDLTGGGAPLPPATQDYFETRMGRDLSGVRVHEGGGADALNSSIAARAFTYQNHIWLGGGESAGPSFTMAHELAHVMQQTAPGPIGPQRREAGEAGEASAAEEAVQRKENAFWLPTGTVSAKGLHTVMHDKALGAIRKVNGDILTEVPIPGANRRLVDLRARGRADIYTATPNPKVMVPGVKQVAAAGTPADATAEAGAAEPAAAEPPASVPTTPPPPPTAAAAPTIPGLDNFTPSLVDGAMEQGSTVLTHEDRRAPKIDQGRLTDMASAPQNILIGEMKPAHDLDYRESGAQQIANYVAGITAVAGQVNAVAGPARSNSLWNPNAKVISPGGVTIPPGWDASKPHTDWDYPSMMIRHYKPSRPPVKGGAAKPTAQSAKQGRPVSTPIRGRWMMAADNMPGHQGVFVYFLAPNPADLRAALKPSSTRKQFRGLVKKVEKIRKDLIVAPKATAAGGKGKAQPRRLQNAAPPLPRASAAPPLVARKDEKEVKDSFKAATWEIERTGAGLAAGQKDESLLAGYTAAADNDLREEIAQQGAMAEWLETKPPTPGVKYDAPTMHKQAVEDLSLLKRIDFWTGLKARPLGILREKFGLFFVKAYEKVVGLGKAVREKFKGFSESKILAGKTGTIVKAAAKVASVVLPRLAKPLLAKMFDTIVNCGIAGFEAKFKELTKDTIIDDIVQTADQLKEKVHEIADDVEAYFKDVIDKTFGPIATEFKDFVETAKLVMDVVSLVKDITAALRIGSCVAGLASAPATVGIGAVVGCGAALGDFILSKLGLSPVDHLIGTILSSCEMQNKLGKLMAAMSFIKTLPQRAGVAVVKEVKSLLANSDTLKGLGSFQNKTYAQHASELFCDPDTQPFPELGYEKTDCSDTGRYRQSKTGSYDIPKEVPLYQKQDPEPASEAPWKDVEIPPGRTGEQAPMPGEKAPKAEPADGPPKPPATPAVPGSPSGAAGEKTAEMADTASEGHLKDTDPAIINLEVRAGFDPTKKYDGSIYYEVGLIGTATGGAVYGPVRVNIYVYSVTKVGNGWQIGFKFKVKKAGDNIVLTDNQSGQQFEIDGGGDKLFTVKLRRPDSTAAAAEPTGQAGKKKKTKK